MALARHCWGAFPDAAFHRFSQKKVVRAFDVVPRTARFCLGSIFFVLVFLVLITVLAPTIRLGFKPPTFQQPDPLAHLAMHGSFTKYDEENMFSAAAQWAQR